MSDFERRAEELGMNRQIERRDFLQGAAIGIVGAYATLRPAQANGQASSNAPDDNDPANYPPLRNGLRGNYPDAVASFDSIRAGKYFTFPVADSDIQEEYDLVVVGGGISGLSSAHFWRTSLPNQRILILDNHDDFGGHAKRNEFHYGGRTYLGYGGTMSIATPFPYSYAAKALLRELEIDVSSSSKYVNHSLDSLGGATFYDKEHFLEDKLVIGNAGRGGRGGRGQGQSNSFESVPLSPAAQKDLARVHGKNPDYMAGMTPEEKKSRLARISYQDFLLQYAKITPDAMPFFLATGGRNNKRVDTMPALEAAEHHSPGFDGLGLEFASLYSEGSFSFHFPDGNASIARLLASRLAPAAFGGPQTMSTIVQTKVDYSQLDQPNTPVRIRLSSPVVRVQHDGVPPMAAYPETTPSTESLVRIAYLQQGQVKAVRARNCILACYNQLIPFLMPEISETQKDALLYPVKVPMMYTNVLLRRWTAFQKLGISRISAPGMYYPSAALDPGTTVGNYQGVTTPDEPVVLHLTRNPNHPGLPRKEQNRLGAQELLSMSFADFEFKIRDELSRMIGSAGFNPADDILAITVNRWPYGYAYTYDLLSDPEMAPEQRPHVIGRARFGRVAIANSDAGAAAFTNQAMQEGNRAVEELLVFEGLA
jgi:spermidine dehydrogenase